MGYKTQIITCGLCLAIGAGVSHMFWPKRVVETKLVEVQKNVHRDTVIVRSPDGTTRTKIKDRTTVSDRTTASREETPVKVQKDWFVTGTVNPFNFSQKGTLGVGRRIIGPFYAYGSISTDLEFGLGLGVEF